MNILNIVLTLRNPAFAQKSTPKNEEFRGVNLNILIKFIKSKLKNPCLSSHLQEFKKLSLIIFAFHSGSYN